MLAEPVDGTDEFGVGAEEEAAFATLDMAGGDGAVAVGEGGAAGEPAFHDDDGEAFVEGGLADGEGVGAEGGFFGFGDEAVVVEGGVIGGETGATAGEVELELVGVVGLVAGDIIVEEGEVFAGFEAAEVEEVGGCGWGWGGEGGNCVFIEDANADNGMTIEIET